MAEEVVEEKKSKGGLIKIILFAGRRHYACCDWPWSWLFRIRK
jgi:hypothetical protein